MHGEAGAHAGGPTGAMGHQPGLPGARHIAGVVEEEDLVGRTRQTSRQAAEGLRVRIAPAQLGRDDRPCPEEGGDGGRETPRPCAAAIARGCW